jgi:hypothetical protein
MPEKFRLIEEKIEVLNAKRSEMVSELETVKSSTATDNEILINHQMRIGAIERIIADFDAQLSVLESELIAEKVVKSRRKIIQESIEIDRRAESLGEKFLSIWLSENPSYSDICDLLSIRREIIELRQEFHQKLRLLFPNVQRLLREKLPELQASTDAFFDELRASGAVLSIIRSDAFSDFRYATDLNVFVLPETMLSGWIRQSLPIVEAIETEKKRASQSEVEIRPLETHQKFSRKISQKLKGMIPIGFIYHKNQS